MASSVSPRLAPMGNRTHRPTTALAVAVSFTDDQMSVTLTDGRVIGVPLCWFPTLLDATPEQRADVRIGGGGVGLHWPELDEDVSVTGLLAGSEVPARDRRLTLADYESPMTYRVPASRQFVGPADGDNLFIEVSSGPSGVSLRRTRFVDMPIKMHPDTGERMRWVSAVSSIEPVPDDQSWVEVTLQRMLVPADDEPTFEDAGASTESFMIDTPEAARRAIPLTAGLRDPAQRASIEMVIRHFVPDAVFPPAPDLPPPAAAG